MAVTEDAGRLSGQLVAPKLVGLALAMMLFTAALVLAVMLIVLQPADGYRMLVWSLILGEAGGLVLALPL